MTYLQSRHKMRCLHITRLTTLLLVLASPLAAADNILVMGLFKDKAVVNINGKQHSLKLGQTSPEGVTLISANSNAAVLEIGGKRSTYPLGTQVGTKFGTPKQTTLEIYRNPQGMYTTGGSINGFPINFLVDTGATLVAMNAPQAKRLGIDYRLAGEPGLVSTASGTAEAYQLKLDRVKVGDIELRNVDAVVLDGPNPTDVLLGMSFLGRLELQNKGEVLQLKRKH